MITTAVVAPPTEPEPGTRHAGRETGTCRRWSPLYHDTMPQRPGAVRWPTSPRPPREDQLDVLIDKGFLLCGSPEEVCEQLQPFVDYGVDQVCFGLPGDATTYEEALELIEIFGTRVIPEFDRDPVVSTDRYRAAAQPKFPAFNRGPLGSPPFSRRPPTDRPAPCSLRNGRHQWTSVRSTTSGHRDEAFDWAREGLERTGAAPDVRDVVELLARHGEEEGAILGRYRRFAEEASASRDSVFGQAQNSRTSGGTTTFSLRWPAPLLGVWSARTPIPCSRI